jgi:hypothetical protein
MRYKHETNFIGMMLVVLVSFLMVGTSLHFNPNNNQLTGAVSGLEGISGFQSASTTLSLEHANTLYDSGTLSANDEFENVGDGKRYKVIVDGESVEFRLITLSSSDPLDTTSSPTPAVTPTDSAVQTDGQPDTYQGLLDAVAEKISEDFVSNSQAMASELDIDHEELMRAMWRETGGTFEPAQPNLAESSAIGLIQFTDETRGILADRLGVEPESFPDDDAIEQLVWVEEFFELKKDENFEITNPGELHLVIFASSAIGEPNSFVAYSLENTPDEYEKNKNVDINGDGEITRGEIDDFYILGLSRDGVSAGATLTEASDFTYTYKDSRGRTVTSESAPTPTITDDYTVEYTEDGELHRDVYVNGRITDSYVRNERGGFDSIQTEDTQDSVETYKAKITTIGPDGSPTDTVVDLGTRNKRAAQERVNEYRKSGLSVSAPYASVSLIPSSGVFEVRNMGTEENPTWVIIGGGNVYTPDDPTDQNSADELANTLRLRTEIRTDYNNLLKSKNLKDTEENRQSYYDHPTPKFNQNKESIPQAIGLTLPSEEDDEGTFNKVISIHLPDGTYEHRYDGEKYESPDENYPDKLQNILDFTTNHPTAELLEDFKAIDGRDVYQENDKFIDQSGATVTSAVKTETIGGKEYEVTYDLESGRKIPKSIIINGQSTNINSNALRQLKSRVREGDVLTKVGSNIQLTQSSTQKEGVEGTKDYRQTKTTITFTFSAQGLSNSVISNEISDGDGNIVELTTTTQEYEYNEERNADVPSRTTQRVYSKSEGENTIDKLNSDYTEITTDTQTGEPLAIEIKKDKENTAASADEDGEITGDAADELKTLHGQWTSRQFISRYLLDPLTQYRGIGYFPSFFLDKDWLKGWREDVDRFFAEHYLGTEYWVSDICEFKVDEVRSRGVAFVSTRTGVAAIGAHIEASRSLPIEPPEESEEEKEYIYKITFNVKNGEFDKDPNAIEELRFDVKLRGATEVDLFTSKFKVKQGESFGRTGSDPNNGAIVLASRALFDEICLIFDEIPFSWTEKTLKNENELCNKIAEPKTEATTLEQETAAEQAPQLNDIY